MRRYREDEGRNDRQRERGGEERDEAVTKGLKRRVGAVYTVAGLLNARIDFHLFISEGYVPIRAGASRSFIIIQY